LQTQREADLDYVLDQFYDMGYPLTHFQQKLEKYIGTVIDPMLIRVPRIKRKKLAKGY
jgi:hypothetical protein